MDAWELFNRKLDAFVSDVRPLVGHMPEYTTAASSIRLLASLEPRKNQDLFDTFVARPYEDRILARDEAFFMDHADLGAGASNAGVVQLLKNVWAQSLAPQDKDAVWAHLQVLIVLNRRCKAARSGGN